jgi:hypothetical protein
MTRALLQRIESCRGVAAMSTPADSIRCVRILFVFPRLLSRGKRAGANEIEQGQTGRGTRKIEIEGQINGQGQTQIEQGQTGRGKRNEGQTGKGKRKIEIEGQTGRGKRKIEGQTGRGKRKSRGKRAGANGQGQIDFQFQKLNIVNIYY